MIYCKNNLNLILNAVTCFLPYVKGCICQTSFINTYTSTLKLKQSLIDFIEFWIVTRNESVMIYDMVVSRTLSVLHCNVSKHSSIKITAASQGILSKNLYGISWCLSLVTLYIWTLTAGHSLASDSISHYSPAQ